MQKAHASGVEKIICIGTDPEDSKNARDFATSHKNVYWTYGIHPEFAENYAEDKALQHPVAIGEIGLDYHYSGYNRAAQIKLFEQMLQLARDHNLPVSLHIREAFADAFSVLDNFPEIRGVVHSFTGNKRELKQALDRGFYIGVNGLVTYTTPPIPPLNCILLETDAPFLTPVPFRGTINTPEYVKYVAACLSENWVWQRKPLWSKQLTMRENFSKSNPSSFAGAQTATVGSRSSLELYNELMNIAREIESCRASL